jgi:hypothetical protein
MIVPTATTACQMGTPDPRIRVNDSSRRMRQASETAELPTCILGHIMLETAPIRRPGRWPNGGL